MANEEMKLCPFRDAPCWGEKCELWYDGSDKCVVMSLIDELSDVSDELSDISSKLDIIGHYVADVSDTIRGK